MTQWSPKKTLFFIEQYERHECLWNNHHAHFRSKEAREAAKDDIVLYMGNPPLTRKDVQSKIRYLRSRYYSEIVKTKPGRQAPDWLLAMDRILQFNRQQVVTEPILIKIKHVYHRNYVLFSEYFK